MSSDDLALEQAYVDHAYDSLTAMRARTQRIFDRIMETGGFQELDHEVALRRRIALLGDSPRPLLFGRIDEEGGERWYIGRRHVETETGDEVVIEWRTLIAEPFYRAGAGDPMGLVRRRQLSVENRQLLSFADDVFDDAAVEPGEVRLRGGDALLAELERARTGEMLDIVATIQVEQDEVIRAPLPGVLAVQGGPGSGKTAIGLHRAAFLLFNHRELARAEVLIVGPSRTYLGYIGQVLPSLGEEAVVQVTLADLVPSVRVRAAGLNGERDAEPDDVQRLKGDPRLATVITHALEQRRGALTSDLVVRVDHKRIAIPAEQANEIARAVAARDIPYRAGRAALRSRLSRALSHASDVLEPADPKLIGADPAFRAALNALWPSISPPAHVDDLLTHADRLARAAVSVLDPDEQARLLRPVARTRGGVPWTHADLALVDEARHLIEGHTSTYGHVVVDEAQDLSPMELRMIARRAPAGSATILGDLAQATAAWGHTSWDDVVAYLPVPNGSATRELQLGYRAPGQVLDLAARLLPVAAPGITPTRSVREGKRTPRVIAVAPEALFAAAAREAGTLADEGLQVGCIVAPHDLRDAERALTAAGIPHGIAERDGLGKQITVLGAPEAKGLEFDAVVVVEPAAIAGDTLRGLRLLYVALTRPIQHLSIVHARPLPAPLTR